MRYFGVVDDVQNFFMKKGRFFRKSSPIFTTKKRFQDIGTQTYPIF